jgi:hypothetical protein
LGVRPGQTGREALAFIDAPFTLYGKDSTHRYLMECTDNFLFVPVALDSGLKDRIAILWVLERNALYVWYT